MTMGEFEMDAHYSRLHNGRIWYVKARGGDARMEFTIHDDAAQDVIRDNFDDMADTIKNEIRDRIEDKWDQSLISDKDKETFLKILEAIL